MTKDTLKIWRVPLLWIVFIYSTIPIARPIINFFESLINLNGVIRSIAVLWIGLIIGVTVKTAKVHRGMVGLSLLALGGLFVGALFIPGQPAEKLHFFEYSLLAVFVQRAFITQGTRQWPLWTLLISLAASLGEETLQFFYPGRVFDLLDVLYNTAGSAFGLGYIFLAQKGGAYQKDRP